jgi:hypothetical protein
LFIGLALNKWKDNLPFVLDSINRNKPDYKSQLNEIINFFTNPETTILPQKNQKLYKFKIGDRVRINLSKAERANLSFKYSLHYGKKKRKKAMPYILLFNIFVFTGKLSKISGQVVSRRITKTGKNTLTPFYGVKIGTQACYLT